MKVLSSNLSEHRLGFPGSSAGKESTRNAGDPEVRKMCGRRDRLPTPVFLGFPGGSDGKESTCNAGELDSEDLLKKGTATHPSILVWSSHTDRGA